VLFVTTTPAPPSVPPAAAGDAANEDGADSRASLIESVLDNLPVWTVIAAGIAFLYLVWATLEILSRYVGHLPKVGP
jgi:hypothetical protein